MLLASLVETSTAISETTKRLQKIDFLAKLLKQLAPDEIDIAVSFLAGRTRQGRIGIGYAALQEARVAAVSTPILTLSDVDRAFEEIQNAQGRGSMERRMELLRKLLGNAAENEQEFLVRLLVGELRQGALEGIMVEALAKASGVAVERVRRAAMVAGDSAVIAQSLLARGEAGLHDFDIQLFRPLQPMLAQTAEGLEDAIEDFGEAALEYKMDGARVQVHKSGQDVVVFSRRMNDVSAAVPEVVEAVRALHAESLILDGEALSFTPFGRPLPFQTTMRRFGRKLDIETMREQLPLTPFFFDVMYLNGGSLLDEPQSRRFEVLSEVAPQYLMPSVVTSNPGRAVEFLDEALGRGHEGIMAKERSSPYTAGARGQSWLKVKQARTLDLVILAAEWGHGRRKGWLSNLHLGARDTEKGGFAMLGKTFKGLTDEMLAWQTEALQKMALARDAYTVYVEPKLVAEIAFNEIQVSPRYPSGLALRFARVKRYRPDKQASEADTFETVQRMAGMIGSAQ